MIAGVMRMFLVVMLAGCGRLGFDTAAGPPGDDDMPADAPIDGDLTALFDDCIFHLTMDEPAWTGAADEVIDKCGGHHGTAIGGATTGPDGVRGRAGQFIGGTSCVQVADASALQPTSALTASAWIDPAALSPDSYGVISRRTNVGVDTSYSVFVWTDGGPKNRLYVDIDTENDRIPDPNADFLNAWHQVTVVYDGSALTAARLQFYVDGQLSFTAPETSSTIPPTTGTPPLSIGCLPLGGPAQSFVGRIDEVVLWKRALSAAEVAQWHAATKP
jgi:hypothetical protein